MRDLLISFDSRAGFLTLYLEFTNKSHFIKKFSVF